MKFEEAFTFEDVLIVPKYSEIRSRADIDLSVSLSKGLNFRIPVFPANMKTLVNARVAEELYKLGGLCLLHRFMPFEEQLDILKSLQNKYEDIYDYVGVSIGVKPEDRKNVEVFYNFGANIVCIDVAHGHSVGAMDMVKYVSQHFPEVFLIAGNVATAEGALDLWEAGADACKIGVGSGSICSTRITTGHGVPQLSALMDVSEALKHSSLKDKFIIADGGCSKVADIVKSLVFADMVMCGNMFAGAAETPGDIIDIDGKQYKNYDGSSTHKSDFIEGVKALVEVKPEIGVIVKGMMEGIASGCSYSGVHNLKGLQINAKLVKITNAGIRESHAHDVRVLG